MKKVLSILMSFLLLWSLALPAAAAETAATLRLEKTEGTVKVSNASGKSVTITKGMRLYSGYTISTEKDSYAYVSLDSTKAVKLDASSKAEVQKSGKKLELTATAGKLFFNVTAPVEKDESLNIRTSTMVTGVRGTSGWVEVVGRFSSRVHLLEGTLTVTSSEPATGQMRQATITSGQTATAALRETSQPGSQVTLTVGGVQEKLVPGFVAVEVEKDPVLQQKIAAKSPLSVPAIIGGAQERLAEEQKAADTAQKTLDKQLDKVGADDVKQVFEGPVGKTDDDDDDDNDSPVTPPVDPPVEPPVEPTSPTMTLDSPTAAALKAALETTGVTNVTVANAGVNDLSTESYTVSSGQTLDIQSGTFDVGSGQTLTVNGTLSNSGTVNVAGTMNVNVNGSATNNGAITITSTQSVHVAGILTNSGSIDVGDKTNPGLLEIQKGGTLNNQEKGTITIHYATSDIFGSMENYGDFNNLGTLNNDGSFTNTGKLANTGSVTNNASFTVDGGTVEIPAGGRIESIRTNLDSGTAAAGVVVSGGTFNVTGGSVSAAVSGDAAVSSDTVCSALKAAGGIVNISGGSVSAAVSGDAAQSSDATCIALMVADGTANISGGSVFAAVSGDAAESSKAACAALMVAGGTANIFGGTVSGDFGILVGGGTVNISGGTVSSSENGIGILLSGGELIMTKGEVTSPVAGISMEGGTAEISGGSVNGGRYGVYVDQDSETIPEITGTAVITLKAEPDETDMLNGYAVYGSFNFTGGTLRAKTQSNFFNKEFPPQCDAEVFAGGPDTEGYYTATPKFPEL